MTFAWPALLFVAVAFWVGGFFAGSLQRRKPNRSKATEILLLRTEPCSLPDRINYHLICVLCDSRWRFVGMPIPVDSTVLTCPMCGASAAARDVQAALRETLRQAVSAPPSETVQ